MGDGLLSLNWNNHGATFCHTLAALRGKDKYTDVTVSCEGNFYQVHKLVLSTCSEYFEKIFENTPCKHPVIVLRDVQCDELESLLNYMYKGVVSVAQSDLSRLIKVAELLQIKGLAVPDEPPNPSKSGSHKRSNDDRISPRSSTDSPYPKRRRRRESDNYQPGTSSSSHSKNSESHEPSWSEDRDNRLLDDRLQEPLHSPVTVNVDETLVKEEILDNDSEDQVPETDYGGLGDHSGDASQDAGGLMIPKFDDAKDDEAEPSPVTLPDPVVEALAGPSGLQGWADGGDIARRMALGEGFGSGESQDMSSSVGLPPQASGQPQQMALVEGLPDWGEAERKKRRRRSQGESPQWYSCGICPYKSLKPCNLRRHIMTHTGEKPFECPLCPLRFALKVNLDTHVRRHIGEKPFACSVCSYRSAHKSDLKKHMASHNRIQS
ncbi:zinc finger and BTB domain-containing protein 7A-like isoform X16 [Macrobrachium rosenbergii]|uniref:zinc finger and BTB domain-containing protein 7A-like isoform X16 n=1 Tax=Macrobrachium rosenbergii TaxID=79674 RepID=UPI0034D55C3C